MMAYSIPSPANTSYVAPSKGRMNDVHNEIGAIAEEPVFVDNAVHHVIYEPVQSESKSIQISKPNQKDFQPTHPRKYRISEEESSVRFPAFVSIVLVVASAILILPNVRLPPLTVPATFKLPPI